MPAKPWEYYRHQRKPLLIAPLYIRFDINSRIVLRPWYRTIPPYGPRTDNISHANNSMQSIKLIPGDSISTALSPIPWNSKHDRIITKLSIFQKINQFRTLLERVFTVIVEPYAPDCYEGFTFVADVRGIGTEIWEKA